jgi:hypothetical protein
MAAYTSGAHDDMTQPRYDDEKAGRAELPQATVAIAQENHLSLGAMLKGTAANRLTPFEAKAALINACVPPPPVVRPTCY